MKLYNLMKPVMEAKHVGVLYHFTVMEHSVSPDEKLQEVYRDKILPLIHDGRLTIYRTIMAMPNWKPSKQRPLGIHWSWDEEAAQAYDGADRNEDFIPWTMVAEVPVSSIDWSRTLVQNASADYESECEITLLPGKDKFGILKHWYKRR